MRVYLLRHGLSVSNVAGLVTGTPADELVEAGRLQALALGRWLRKGGVRPEAFYVSHWGRARETAQLAWPDADWQEDARVGETDAGEVALLARAAFVARWPAFYDDPSNAYPGGESHLDLNRRVLSFWHELVQRELRSVLIATHSGPVSCILQRVLGVPMARFPAFLPAHSTVSVIDAGADGEGRLLSFSCGPQEHVFFGAGGA